MSLVMRYLQMRNNSRNMLVALKYSTQKKKKPLPTQLEKFRKLQELFQKNDGKPIWLKGGMLDKVMYHTTLGLCAVGLIMDFIFYFGYVLA